MTTSRILVSAAWISCVTSMSLRYRSRRFLRLAAAALDDAGSAALDLRRVDAEVAEALLLERDRVSHAELRAAVVELLEVPDRLLIVSRDVGGEPPCGRERGGGDRRRTPDRRP